MSTQLQEARHGRTTPAIERLSAVENVPVDKLIEQVSSGRAVIPLNPAHAPEFPVIVGSAFHTKINANIGRSPTRSSQDEELRKMRIAIDAGADLVMDLSVGTDITTIRRSIIRNCTVPLGTVPVYEAFARAGGDIGGLDEALLLDVIREQAEEGVDFMTIHAGILRGHIEMAVNRVMGIVSRGGAILAEWMSSTGRDNPFYSQWDNIMDICAEHDVTVSLGDGLRPGCLADASDEAQFAELDVLGELVKRCRAHGVQVMVEGPGHIPLNEIKMNVERQEEVCDGAPFYVLGPVVTDIAPGYDHITSCIGAAHAAYYGAALLCYVTPAEHLGLPTDEEVRTGVVVYRIAAHSADIARGLPGARDRDDEISRARRRFDWERQFELALDGDTARKRYEQTRAEQEDGENSQDYCSMCGRDFCAVRNTEKIRKGDG